MTISSVKVIICNGTYWSRRLVSLFKAECPEKFVTLSNVQET